MRSVTAILPTFGRHELTFEAVSRLRTQSLPPEHILVVDDGSPSPFPALAGVEVLRHESNRGFAAAVNTGIRHTHTPLAAVLNNDVTLAPDWLERLQAVLFEQDSDFACGKLYRPDGLLDGTFDLLSRGGLAWRAGAGRPDGELWSRPQPVLFTSFTAVLLRTDGLWLDETYHSYYEDVEWSLRAAIHNKTGYFDPRATGIHTGSATAGAWSAYSTRQLLRNHRRLALQYLLPEYGREYRIARTLFRALCLQHGQWPDVPREHVEPHERPARLGEILQASEELLFELQRETGMDRLWRWYFQLTGGAG